MRKSLRWSVVLVIILSASSLVSSNSTPVAEAKTVPTGILPPTPRTFYTYSSLASTLTNLTVQHSGILTLQTIGQSWENRSILAIRLSVGGGPKKEILLIGLHHADERQSLEVVMYQLRYFLANLNNTRVQAILDRANISFVPLLNPDGYEYARTKDSTWRKNRRDNGDGTFGVDPNRNYGYMWGTGTSFGIETNSSEYRGPAAFSEPETRAVRDFALEHPPVLSISYHTAGEIVLYPWSYTRHPARDDGLFRLYAEDMSAANGYRILQEGHSNHVKPGNSDDWLYSTLGTLAFTFEVGPAFSSDQRGEIRPIVQENIEPMLLASEMVLHLKDLGCAPTTLVCIPPVSVMILGIPAVGGTVFFAQRIRRRSRSRDENAGIAGWR